VKAGKHLRVRPTSPRRSRIPHGRYPSRYAGNTRNKATPCRPSCPRDPTTRSAISRCASAFIHGTNKPWGVGLRVSHGCVRLYPEDIARLFHEVPVGTQVHIINEPYLAGWRNGQLYLEVHQPLAEDTKRWNGSLKPMEQVVVKKAADSPEKVDWEKAGIIAREARGIPVPVTSGSPDLAELLAKAPQVSSTPPWAPVEYEKADPEQRAASANASTGN
jgi:hypothetical protein